MSRRYDNTLVRRANCPFPSTTSNSIHNGVFIRNSQHNECKIEIGADSQNYVELGLLKKLKEVADSIVDIMSPRHLMIMAEFGHGKSFSVKCVQEYLFLNYDFIVLGLTLGNNIEAYKSSKDDILVNDILFELKTAYDKLSDTIFPDKETVRSKYNLNGKNTFSNILKNYDKAFKELGCQVFIFIDEIDKIMKGDISPKNKKNLVENMKILADNFNLSISLWAMGTNDVETIINEIGKDYIERFEPVTGRMSVTDTLKLVKEKCLKVVKHRKNIPFSDIVIQQLHLLNRGNIRYIGKFCFNLWLYSAQEAKKIGNQEYKAFMASNLKSYVLEKFPNVDDEEIKIISHLIINKRISIVRLKKMLTKKSKIPDVINFLTCNSGFKKISRSFQIDDDLREEFLQSLRK